MKGIIFDKDGTLLKFDSFWRPVTEHAVEYILRERKAPPGMKDRMMEAAGLDSGICGLIYRGTYAQLSEAFQNVLEEGGMDADRMDELTLEAFRNSMEAGKIIPACADMDEVFRRLKESGVRLFLVTTDCREITGRCLDKLKIRQYFDEIYTDDDDRGHPKPDPYLIQEIIKKYGMKKEELVMVGDTVTDMEFAGNGGIKAIGVADKEADRRILKRYTETVIDNIGYLPEIRERESREKGKST